MSANPSIRLEDKKPLYCICYEYWNPAIKKWVADDLYLNASDAGEARVTFLLSEDPRTKRRIIILGIAPVVGYFVDDKHGEKLSV